MEHWYRVAIPRSEVREGRSFNPDEFAIALEAHEDLIESDISVTACANGNVLGDAQSVRLFAIQYIKGIDVDSIATEKPDMIDKYLYVGLSRANLYLALTVNEKLPIADLGVKEQEPIMNLVDQILAARKKTYEADTRALEKEIDVLVSKLYGLTYEEVKIVEPAFALSEEEYNGYECA